MRQQRPTMKYSVAIVLTIALLSDGASAFERYAGLASSEHQSDLAKALNLIVSTVTPQLYFRKREIMVQEYEEAKINKALAVNPVQAEYWRLTDQNSQSAAVEHTLEGCQLRFGSPCTLLATNDDLAPTVNSAAKNMPRLNYSGQFDIDKIPIVTDEVKKRTDIQRYWSTAEPKAIAIHPTGQLFVFSGRSTVNEAAETALSRCNLRPSRNIVDGPCYLYAINNDIVISKRQVTP